MALMISKRLFYIDSHDRVSGTHSDFSFVLEFQDDYDHAVVLQVNIPKSYYIVKNGLNTFTLQEGLSSVIITLPFGNYTRSSFKTQLQTSLNASSPNGWTYVVSIPNTAITADTGYYYFAVSGNSSQPSFILNTGLYEQLGFEPNSTNTFVGNNLTSRNVVKFQAEDNLFIHSDLCSNGTDDVLQEIFGVDNPSFGNIIYQCQVVEAYAKPITTSNNNVYHFYLTDEDSNPIDLNGQNMTFTLLLFKKQNVLTLLDKVLKLYLLQ